MSGGGLHASADWSYRGCEAASDRLQAVLKVVAQPF